jgi:hypothetical protein
MNDFKYCVSLQIEHPNIDPNQLSINVAFQPETVHRVGDQRRTPKGQLLKGTYDVSYWTATLELFDGMEFAESLQMIVSMLRPHHTFLRELVQEGGKLSLFFGLFATGLCDFIIPSRLMLELADLNIDLRLDYYYAGSDASAANE